MVWPSESNKINYEHLSHQQIIYAPFVGVVVLVLSMHKNVINYTFPPLYRMVTYAIQYIIK